MDTQGTATHIDLYMAHTWHCHLPENTSMVLSSVCLTVWYLMSVCLYISLVCVNRVTVLLVCECGVGFEYQKCVCAVSPLWSACVVMPWNSGLGSNQSSTPHCIHFVGTYNMQSSLITPLTQSSVPSKHPKNTLARLLSHQSVIPEETDRFVIWTVKVSHWRSYYHYIVIVEHHRRIFLKEVLQTKSTLRLKSLAPCRKTLHSPASSEEF